eukprot:SM000174S03333  [mRNA]  locus=s174:25333:28479:+ [translate_table: standard]
MAPAKALALLLLLLCAAASPLGGCSATKMIISVRTLNDIYSRLKWPATQTVELQLLNDVTTPSTITFNKSFSCTILRSSSSTPHSIKSQSDKAPVLLLSQVNNFLMMDTNLHIPIINGTSPKPCPYKVFAYIEPTVCPALAIDLCNRVQITRGTLDGGIHLFRSTNSLIDSNHISSLDWGVIVGHTGGGRWTTSLLNNVVSNNRIQGYVTGVNVAYGATGIYILNNYIDEFIFSGVTLGRGAHNTGDAMHNVVANNYIEALNTTAIVIPDAAGIYCVLHWINPNNTLSCNYIVGRIPHCIYLDFGTSGVQIHGTVCIHSGNGLKINTGHSNNIRGMVIAEPYAQPGYIAPQLFWNCLTDPGTSWDEQRQQFFNTPQFRALYPWLTNFCSITQINGVSCNAPGGLNASQTGNCSGMPTANYWESVIVAAISGHVPEFYGLNILPAQPNINTVTYLKYKGPSAVVTNANYTLGFNDPANDDYGLHPNSPIFQTYPTFPNCPKANNGPKPVASSLYLTKFNS